MTQEEILAKLNKFEMPNVGVYFLFKDSEVIYIGRSENIFTRIHDHLKDKTFDYYSFIKCDTKESSIKLEIELIKKFRPKLNKIRGSEIVESEICQVQKLLEGLNTRLNKLNGEKDFLDSL